MTLNGKKIPSFTNNKSNAYEKHRSRVQRARPTVDVSPPEIRSHVLHNAKGLQLERERQAKIVRENFILLKKLRDIMHRKRIEDKTDRLIWERTPCLRIH